ncbi:hypothetical protein Vretimale_385 [Volvox reticuliferus]|uniref:Uncharacterized protein n=1 Tax=Volvox reticuliferus TaxID=1737510 RepID=A0A8J4FY79_9CHLO|nr:hypothetical protein Vretimale_385 [Volvox reticuliferus]
MQDAAGYPGEPAGPFAVYQYESQHACSPNKRVASRLNKEGPANRQRRSSGTGTGYGPCSNTTVLLASHGTENPSAEARNPSHPSQYQCHYRHFYQHHHHQHQDHHRQHCQDVNYPLPQQGSPPQEHSPADWVTTSQSGGQATANFAAAAAAWPSGTVADLDGARLQTAWPHNSVTAATRTPRPSAAPTGAHRSDAAAAASFQHPECVLANMTGPGAAPSDISWATNSLQGGHTTAHVSHQPPSTSPYGNTGAMAVPYSRPLPPPTSSSLGPAPGPVTPSSQQAPLPTTAVHASGAYMYTPPFSSLTLNSTPPTPYSKSIVVPPRDGPSAVAAVRPYGTRQWQTHMSTPQAPPASQPPLLRSSVPPSLTIPTTPPHPSTSGATYCEADSHVAALSLYERTRASVASVTTSPEGPLTFMGSCPPAAASYECDRPPSVTAAEPATPGGVAVTHEECAAASAAGGTSLIQLPGNPLPPSRRSQCPSPHTPCTPTVLSGSPLASPSAPAPAPAPPSPPIKPPTTCSECIAAHLRVRMLVIRAAVGVC